jgi:hypothetical protein
MDEEGEWGKLQGEQWRKSQEGVGESGAWIISPTSAEGR